jgi:hypothetical protein
MALLTTYDSKNITFVITPQALPVSIPIFGFGQKKLDIKRSSEQFKTEQGVDGDITRTKTNDLSAKVMFSLQRGSFSIPQLDLLRIADEQGNNGIFDLVITDSNSGSVNTGKDCFFMKLPDNEDGKDYEYEIFVTTLVATRLPQG